MFLGSIELIERNPKLAVPCLASEYSSCGLEMHIQ